MPNTNPPGPPSNFHASPFGLTSITPTFAIRRNPPTSPSIASNKLGSTCTYTINTRLNRSFPSSHGLCGSVTPSPHAGSPVGVVGWSLPPSWRVMEIACGMPSTSRRRLAATTPHRSPGWVLGPVAASSCTGPALGGRKTCLKSRDSRLLEHD